MNKARIWRPLAILAIVSAVLLVAPAIASADRTVHGAVTNVHHSGDHFGLHTAHGNYQIYTSHHTDFDGCDWGWMQPGRHIGVRIHHRNSGPGWIATRVAPWGGNWWGGEGGSGHHHHGQDWWR